MAVERFDWSLTIGRWRGVSVRLHPAMILVAVVATLWSCSASVLSIVGSMTSITLVTLGLLVVSVLTHEWGHWVVARRFGVALPRIVLSPVGDISHGIEFPSPWQTAVWAAAGPLANLVICGTCLGTLAVLVPNQQWYELFYPLTPAWNVRSGITAVQTMQIAVWLNLLLVFVNSLPAFPFDGAHLLRALLRGGLPSLSRSSMGNLMFVIGIVSTIGMFTAAAIVGRTQSDTLFPTWWGLIAIAIVMLIGSVRELRLQDQHEAARRIEEGKLPAPVGRESRSLVRSSDYFQPNGADADGWEIINQHLVDIEQQDDLLLDELLRRVHDQGIDSLTPDQRDVLNRISTRYRRRLHGKQRGINEP